MGKQVLDIEQMQHLKYLGVDTSKASMALVYRNKHGDIVDWNIVDKDIHEEDIGQYNPYIRSMYGTFTLQDILDLLPDVIVNDYEKLELRIKRFAYGSGKNMYAVLYEKQDYVDWFIMYSDSILIDAAYEMLCWVLTNKYIQ